MLNVEISKGFAEFSLRVKFEADDDITVLFGPSGCGKTTILRCITGLTQPDSGRIELNGETYFSSAERKNIPPKDRGVGIVFQDYALFPHMTAEKNILYGAKSSLDNQRLEYESLLELLKIEGLTRRYPRALSGGEQQRIALARAMMSEPRILLLDEPLNALHSDIRLELQDELVKLQRTKKIPFIVVTHDIHEAEKLGDRMIRLENGKIVDGKPIETHK